MRIEWQADPDNPVWQQCFSYNSGATWKVSWVMSFSPSSPAVTADSQAIAFLR